MKDYYSAGWRRLQSRPWLRHRFGFALGLIGAVALVVTASSAADAQRGDTNPSLERLQLAAADRAPTSLAAAYASTSKELSQGLALKPGASKELAAQQLAAPQGKDWLQLRIRPGDSLSGLFDHYGLPAEDWRAILALGKQVKPLTRIRPGEKLQVRRDAGGHVSELRYDLDNARTLQVQRQAAAYTASTLEAPVAVRHGYAVGLIDSSLFTAAQHAGLSNEMAMELAVIFGWDIDFALDIRSGDRFSVIYEELYRHNRKVGNGDIIAAEFINQGIRHQAFRHKTGDQVNFYGADGRSLRKAFLRTPVDFTRISSGFGWRRHPIHRSFRVHRGVDYAAPHGTPIKSSGDGRVEFRGRKGGYGNVVVVQHGAGVETLYGHMSRFANGLIRGTRVKQGQTIGYVGATGWATGPHLHYEFRLNGVHKDPMKVKLAAATPLLNKHRGEFTLAIQPYVAQLDALSQIRVASNDVDGGRE
ncbi:MAG: M23 family metallopeptidase [Nevskiales bacterium]